ncbi:MAG: hypothetical protein ACYDCO_08910 [Armatimonadota bacterium]
MTLFILVALLFASLVAAFMVRATWAYSLPGLVLLMLIFWLLFAG